jgi:syntaxin-binding protein 1
MISENPAAKSMLKRRQNGEVAKLREMRDIVTSVPELQQHQELYSLHFGLAETVMERFKTRQLEEVAMCEQNISTGTFPDGEVLKNALNEMVPILNNPKVLLSDKLRLLLIYQIHMKGFANVDRRRLETHAGLTQSDKDAITNMEFLLNNRPTLPTNTDNITRFMSSLSFKGKKKEEQEDVPYDISRYQPALKKILTNLIDNQLDFDAFPQVGASDSPGTNPPASPTKKPPTSLRKSNKPAWELKSDDPSKPAPSQTTGGKIIVFIAGGASYSELRAAYEVSKAKNREILVGSTDIVAPDDFVEALRLMRYQAAGNPTSPPQGNLGLSPKPIAVRSSSPLKPPGDKPRRSKGGVLEPPHMHMPNHLKDHQHRSSMPNLHSELEANSDQVKPSSTREPRKPLPTPGQYNTISVQRTASEQTPQAPRPQNPYKAATASKGGFFSKLFQ